MTVFEIDVHSSVDNVIQSLACIANKVTFKLK